MIIIIINTTQPVLMVIIPCCSPVPIVTCFGCNHPLANAFHCGPFAIKCRVAVRD